MSIEISADRRAEKARLLAEAQEAREKNYHSSLEQRGLLKEVENLTTRNANHDELFEITVKIADSTDIEFAIDLVCKEVETATIMQVHQNLDIGQKAPYAGENAVAELKNALLIRFAKGYMLQRNPTDKTADMTAEISEAVKSVQNNVGLNELSGPTESPTTYYKVVCSAACRLVATEHEKIAVGLATYSGAESVELFERFIKGESDLSPLLLEADTYVKWLMDEKGSVTTNPNKAVALVCDGKSHLTTNLYFREQFTLP